MENFHRLKQRNLWKSSLSKVSCYTVIYNCIILFSCFYYVLCTQLSTNYLLVYTEPVRTTVIPTINYLLVIFYFLLDSSSRGSFNSCDLYESHTREYGWFRSTIVEVTLPWSWPEAPDVVGIVSGNSTVSSMSLVLEMLLKGITCINFTVNFEPSLVSTNRR